MARPTMAEVHPRLALLKTKVFGNTVPKYAEKVEKEVSQSKLNMSMSLEEEMSWFTSESNTKNSSINSKGSSSTHLSSTAHHSVGIDGSELL